MSLGDFCMLQKDSIGAEDYYKKALGCFKSIYGEGHLIISDMSIKLKNYKTAWIIRYSILGLKHPETLEALRLYQESLSKYDGTEALTERFLEYIKNNLHMPRLEQLDELLEKPKTVRKLNRNLILRFTLPNTLFLFLYLAAIEAVLPMKWLPYALLIFNLQLMHLGYINGRNKNYIAFADMAVFAFLPSLLAGLSMKTGGALGKVLSYDLIMLWIHKFDFEAVGWLGANMNNLAPDLILGRIMPRYTLLGLGAFRYLLFALMVLV